MIAAMHATVTSTQGGARVPPMATRGILRLLAAAGMALAGFLLFTHIAAHWHAARAVVPFCSGLSWLDCDSVLNSPWSAWLGVPVSGFATALYALMLWWLCWIRPGRSAAQLARTWRRLQVGGWTILAAAAWFVWLQFDMDRWCAYCLSEHMVGVVLAGLIWLHSGAARNRGDRFGWGRALLGLIPVAILIGGQMFFPVTSSVAAGAIDANGRWVEQPTGAGRTTALRDGAVVLDVSARPVVGFAGASRFVVEVMDYTCARCRRVSRVMDQATGMLGPDTAVVMVFYPLSGDCNPKIAETRQEHEYACGITRIALAVWLADPLAFQALHRWLIEHEDPAPALEPTRQQAERLIGARRLRRLLADERLDQMIRRDQQVTERLGLRNLPGVFIGNWHSPMLPAFPGDMAELIDRELADAASPVQ